MDDRIAFNQAVFQHGIVAENIRYAVTHPQYEGPLEDDLENKYIIVGSDQTGVLLEILYNRIDDETVNVFHAMKCWNIFLPLLDA